MPMQVLVPSSNQTGWGFMAETVEGLLGESARATSRPLWSRLSWMVLACALPTVAVLVYKMMRAADYVGRDNDDVMRLVQVRDLLAGQGWFDLTQTRLGLDGTLMHWSRLIDLPIASLVLLFRPIAGPERAEAIALAIWPILLVVPLLAAMGLAGRRIGGPQCMNFCLGLTAIVATSGNRFHAGSIDHHNVQLVLVATMAAMVVDRRYGAMSFAIAGVAAAMAIAIGVETTPFVAVICLVVAVLWAWEGRAFAAAAIAFGVALAATVTVAFFLTVPPHLYRVVTCDNLSVAFVSLSVTGGILLALAAAAASRFERPMRFAALGVNGALVAGVLLAIAPECLHNPLADLDPLLHELWLDAVSEARSFPAIATQNPSALGALYFCGLYAMAICAWRTRRADSTVLYLTLLALVALNWGISLIQVRAAVFASLLAILPISLLLVDLRARALASVRAPGAWLVYIFAIFISLPMVWAVAGELVANSSENAAETAKRREEPRRCHSAEAMADLQKIEPTLVVGPSNIGAWILRFTKHSALSAPYHRNPEGMLAELKIGLAAPNEASGMLKRLGDPVLAFCAKDPQTRMIIAKSPKGFYGQLDDGRIPEFLEALPVKSGTGLQLFRLKSEPMAMTPEKP